MYIERNKNPELWAIARVAGYNGMKLEARAFPDYGKDVHSCWNEGRKDYFYLVRLLDNVALPIPENGSPFIQGITLKELPPGTCLVERADGSYTHCTIFFRPEEITALLPAPVKLDQDVKIVLFYTRHLKSSYAGISNYRLHQALEHGTITEERWNSAKSKAIELGLLNKAGAITASGRNIETWRDDYALRKELRLLEGAI